jgi:hypothetical protein
VVLTPLRSAPFLGSMQEYADRLRRIADLTALRGLMALERGNTAQAETFLRRALELCPSKEAGESGGGLIFSGRAMAEHLLERLTSPSR